MSWLRFLSGGRRKRSEWNNVDARGGLTCGRLGESLLLGGEIGPHDWEALSDEGVSVVVNLQEEQQDVFSPHEKVDGYLWLPAPDQRAPSVEQLAQGVAFVQASIRNGRRVFVHCKAGQGRAPLLCACYLIAEGATIMEAIKQVQYARPSTQLSAEQSVRLRDFAHHLSTLNSPAPSTSDPANAPTPFDRALPPALPSGHSQPAPDESSRASAAAPANGTPANGTPANGTPAQNAPTVVMPAPVPASKP